MPELGEIVSALLNGAIDAVESSEIQHLRHHLEVVKALDSGSPDLPKLEELLKAGYLPDYFAGAEMSITAQLNMSTTRERSTSGGATATLGPVSVHGALSESFRQATETNLSVTIQLQRRSRSAGVEQTRDGLRPVS